MKVYILHKLPNRVRLKFEEGILNINIFEAKLLVGGEKINLRYNKINKTLLIQFDPNEISLKEILYKVFTIYSEMHDDAILDIIDGKPKEENKFINGIKNLDHTMLASAGSLLVQGVGSACGRGGGRGKRFQKGANLLSGGMTSFAILGHAYRDMSKNKELDLEVLPAMFLLKSFIENPKISTLAVTLATTFGRHLLVKDENKKVDRKTTKLINNKQKYISNKK